MTQPTPTESARIPALVLTGALCALAAGATIMTSPPAQGSAPQGWTENRQVVKSVAGDFNGDGLADYVDHDRNTGQFFVHTNLGTNGRASQCADAQIPPSRHLGFSANGANWKVANTVYESTIRPDGSVMIGDFNGDGFADFAEHDDVTGEFLVSLNDTRAGGSFKRAATSSGPTCTGATCEVLVADFTGDGVADYADHDLSTGWIYIHENLLRTKGVVTFAPVGQNWATVRACSETERCSAYPIDSNGDGYADIVLHVPTGGNETYLEYHPSTQTYLAASHRLDVAGGETVTGDFDGDGKGEYASHDPATGLLTFPSMVSDAALRTYNFACGRMTWAACGGVGCDLLGLPGGSPAP